MDAFCRCFEGQKPLVGLGVEPQRHRPLQKPSSVALQYSSIICSIRAGCSAVWFG
jgi:hypothetical protein